jgi:aminocarboxymuconate-semialdehyde decarboxylase
MKQHDIEMRPYGPTAGREHINGVSNRPKTLTVDLHNHVRTPDADILVKPHLPKDFHPSVGVASELTMNTNKKQSEDREIPFTDINIRLAQMDKSLLDISALSCSPQQFFYMVDKNLCAESAEIINNNIANTVKTNPKRLTGLGTVPLQNTDLAIKELERCFKLGFKGIQIGARVGNEELSAPRLEPFWKRCEELDILIFIHPSSFYSDRFGEHYMLNVIGNPLDTTVAVHYLIFDGVMARYPKIKFYLSHGGAFPASYAARMDHAYGARIDARQKIYEKPTTYLKQFYFDTLVFAVDQLEFLIKKYGADHVAIGTDYPADMAEHDPVEHVYQVGSITEEDREKICGLNALKLLNLSESDFK